MFTSPHTQTHIVACRGWRLTKGSTHRITKDKPWISPQDIPMAGAVAKCGNGGCMCVSVCLFVCVCVNYVCVEAVGALSSGSCIGWRGLLIFFKALFTEPLGFRLSQDMHYRSASHTPTRTYTHTHACASAGYRCWFQLTLFAMIGIIGLSCPQWAVGKYASLCMCGRLCVRVCVYCGLLFLNLLQRKLWF